jgi:hypothetical protein
VRHRELTFLTDENISPRVVACLRDRGHDVLDVKERGWQGKSDVFLLRKAWKAHRFIPSPTIVISERWRSINTNPVTACSTCDCETSEPPMPSTP